MRRTVLFVTASIFCASAFLSPSAFAAELSLKADKPALAVGEITRVDVILSGGEPTLGTDIVLLYDPKTLEITGVENGALYPAYQPSAGKRINSGDGKITLSGSAGINQPVSASGVFASLSIKALKGGQAKISFDYLPNSTNKTGVIDFSGKELLTSPPKEIILNISSPNLLASIVSGILSPLYLFLQSLFGKR